MLDNEDQIKNCKEGVTNGPPLKELACGVLHPHQTPGAKPALPVCVADRKFRAVLPLPIRSHIICITRGRLHIKMGNICASRLACTTSEKTWN